MSRMPLSNGSLLRVLFLPRFFAVCVAEGIVGGDEGPVSGVAQVVCHGVRVVGVHGEEGQEKDGEVRGEVKGKVEESQGQPLMCMA